MSNSLSARPINFVNEIRLLGMRVALEWSQPLYRVIKSFRLKLIDCLRSALKFCARNKVCFANVTLLLCTRFKIRSNKSQFRIDFDIFTLSPNKFKTSKSDSTFSKMSSCCDSNKSADGKSKTCGGHESVCGKVDAQKGSNDCICGDDCKCTICKCCAGSRAQLRCQCGDDCKCVDCKCCPKSAKSGEKSDECKCDDDCKCTICQCCAGSKAQLQCKCGDDCNCVDCKCCPKASKSQSSDSPLNTICMYFISSKNT